VYVLYVQLIVYIYCNMARFFIIIRTYHLRFIPEGVAETSQIFLRDAIVLPKLLSHVKVKVNIVYSV
jgi:hypothetical protein